MPEGCLTTPWTVEDDCKKCHCLAARVLRRAVSKECVQFLLRQNEENLQAEDRLQLRVFSLAPARSHFQLALCVGRISSQVLDESLGSSPALSAMLSPQAICCSHKRESV